MEQINLLYEMTILTTESLSHQTLLCLQKLSLSILNFIYTSTALLVNTSWPNHQIKVLSCKLTESQKFLLTFDIYNIKQNAPVHKNTVYGGLF